MGAARRQHHAQQKAMRAANAEFKRQEKLMQQQQQAFAASLKLQRDAMEAETEEMRAAKTTELASTLASGDRGVRTARSTRATTAGLARGIAQLRIPLNLGGGSASGSGLNIG